MSAKWVRAKQWDDRNLTGPLTPVKWVLRLFSGIPLAVVLLVLVSLYGVLASVPIGILAMAPTWGFYGLTVLASIALGAVVPTWIAVRMMRSRGAGVPPRVVVGVLGVVGLSVLSVWAWRVVAWPRLRYDPITGSGVEFFAGFVERYKSVQFRRLPGIEMSELEFYAWWPMNLVLILFVVNMVVATLRRIEFTFPRVGVLMVHTGIVTIALGSVYYTLHKKEGDALLLAGQPDAQGIPTVGPPEAGFYDNTATALWVTQDLTDGWEQRRLERLPRYNDYNLAAIPGAELPTWTEGPQGHRDHGPLDIRVAEGPRAFGQPGAVDADVSFRVVGYASYADLEQRWLPTGEAGEGAKTGGDAARSMREVVAVLDMTTPEGAPVPSRTWRLVPESPADRISRLELMAIEYTRGMSEERWTALSSVLPPGTRHALVVSVPGTGGAGGGAGLAGGRAVYAVEEGQEITVENTGYRIKVQSLQAEPPFPIVTEGYRGATSSLAVVRITPPGEGGKPAAAYDRWIYHRFPEISQDLLQEVNERGMPQRRDATSDIRVEYIDASLLQVYFDEREDGTVRALVRLPGGAATVRTGLTPGASIEAAPKLALKLGERHDRVTRVEVPRVVHPDAREKDRIGNHKAAAIAVEIRDQSGPQGVHWLPFTQYLSVGQETQRTIPISGGRELTLAFGRVRHLFDPPMTVRLQTFEMIPYPHSTSPRDYRSDVVVSSRWNGVYKDDVRKTSLNEPLLVRTPFVKREDLPMLANALGWAMSVIAPNQYKFSQAGWDMGGWRESEAAVARGEVPRPFARFTILGVGNNPGIYIIATGAVMMSVGIPWAFYLKPWLVRREKERLKRAVARGEITPRGRAAGKNNGTSETPEPSGIHAEVTR